MPKRQQPAFLPFCVDLDPLPHPVGASHARMVLPVPAGDQRYATGCRPQVSEDDLNEAGIDSDLLTQLGQERCAHRGAQITSWQAGAEEVGLEIDRHDCVGGEGDDGRSVGGWSG